MEKALSLRELCERYQISRRTVQGFEKRGLVKASGKNNRGHLLYDCETQKTIEWLIRYQQYGFLLREIQAVKGMTREELVDILVRKRELLSSQRLVLEQTLEQITEEIERLNRQEIISEVSE